jgi:DnaJ like chaperone protein
MPKDKPDQAGWQIQGLKKLYFFDDYIEYKKRRINFNAVHSIQFTSTATKHSINFVPTGTSFESILYLSLKDNSRIQIKQESSFWGGVSEKKHSEAVWKASEIISISTFNSRLTRFEEEFNKKEFLRADEFQFSKNGDLFKNKKLLLNINGRDVTITLGPFQIYVSRARKGFGRLLGAEEFLIPIENDRDCILYMFKYYLGYSFKNEHVREKTIDKRKIFFNAIIRLSAKLAKADGHVSPDEIKKFKEYFDIEGAEIDDAGKIFNQSVKSSERVEDIAKEIYSCLGNNRELLEYIIIGLLQIASADGVFHHSEIEFIGKVSNAFGFTERDKLSLFAMFGIDIDDEQSEEGKEKETSSDSTFIEEHYFRILNVEPGATIDEIKTAYRILARKHHPDVLYSRGIPINEIRKSEDILKSINEAYNHLAQKY